MQEAWLVALERWPREGIPRNPGAWITTTARNRAIDRLRRGARAAGRSSRELEALGGDARSPTRCPTTGCG